MGLSFFQWINKQTLKLTYHDHAKKMNTFLERKLFFKNFFSGPLTKFFHCLQCLWTYLGCFEKQPLLPFLSQHNIWKEDKEKPSGKKMLSSKAFDYVDHKKLWKILKEMSIPATVRASWETCMQVKKHQLELDMEQQTGSKLGKEYVKAIYCHLAYLI